MATAKYKDTFHPSACLNMVMGMGNGGKLSIQNYHKTNYGSRRIINEMVKMTWRNHDQTTSILNVRIDIDARKTFSKKWFYLQHENIDDDCSNNVRQLNRSIIHAH